MNVELLYPLITEAIRRAEALEDLGAPGVYSAHLDLSLLEERAAGILPASNPEGALARRGAVRAALAAREITRARQLAKRFLAEDDAEDALRADLRQLLEQAERGMKNPVIRRAWEEMSSLRARLEQLESSLAELEREQTAAPNTGNTVGTSTTLPRREQRRT